MRGLPAGATGQIHCPHLLLYHSEAQSPQPVLDTQAWTPTSPTWPQALGTGRGGPCHPCTQPPGREGVGSCGVPGATLSWPVAH